MKKILFIIFIFIHSVCLGADGDPMLLPLTDTANRLVSTDANKEPAAVTDLTAWIAGTADRITVSDDSDGTITITIPDTYLPNTVLGTTNEIDITDNLDGTITISLPGSIKLDSATASRILATDGSKLTVSVDDLTSWIAGTANEIEVANDGDGTVTIGIVTSPTLDGTNITGVDHGTDVGLADDDHAGYAWLTGVGRTAQTLVGGEGSGATHYLKLKSNTSSDDRVYFGETGTCYHEGLDAIGINRAVPGSSISNGVYEERLHVYGTGNTGATRTAIAVENTGASSGAVFVAENNAGNGFGAQMSGSNYASGLLPNYGFFYTAGSGTIPMAFATDGTVASGGASPIQFQPGGYHPTTAVSLFLEANGTKKVGIGGEKTPTAQLDVNVVNAAYVGFIIDAAAAQTADMVQLKDSAGNIHHSFSIPGATDPNVYFNKQLGDSDLIVAGDTEANLLRVDAGADDVRQGDWDTNYLVTDKTGDTWWVGSTSGLPFGSMYADDISETVTVAASDTWYEIDGGNFTVGQVNLASLDSSYRIQVTKAGMYKIDWSLVVETAAAAQYIEGTVGVGGTANVQCDNATETATANKQYSIGGTCILDLAASDYISLMVENGTSVQDIIVTHGNLSLLQIGGT